MKVFFAVAFFLLFLGLAYPICREGEGRILVPAVLKSENGSIAAGDLTSFVARTQNGTGEIYTSIDPRVDESTQVSEEIAARIGLLFANSEDCDVFFSIEDSGRVSGVSGPSGGAGMAISVISAATGKETRKDLAITGTIEPDGSIGPVGGVIEKAKVVEGSGLSYFLTPRQGFFENLVLSTMNLSVKVIEVANINQAASLAFSAGRIEANGTRLWAEEVNGSLERNRIQAREEIRELAEGIYSNYSEKILAGNISQRQDVLDYFDVQGKNAKLLLEKGYYYSSANSAFTAMGDLELLGLLNRGFSLQAETYRIEGCVEGIRQAELNSNNWELYVGSRLRESWARRKILDVKGSVALSSEEEAYLLREALFAEGWCKISIGTARMAGEKEGGKIDEKLFEGMAAEKLEIAREAAVSYEEGDDVAWRAKNAESLYMNGSYIASVFDSVYAYSTDNARKRLPGMERVQVQKRVESLLMQNYTGLWPGAYASHGSYFYKSGENSLMPAYYTLEFAYELEKATREIGVGIREGGAGAGLGNEDGEKEEGKEEEGAGGVGSGLEKGEDFGSLAGLMPYMVITLLLLAILMLAVAIRGMVRKED